MLSCPVCGSHETAVFDRRAPVSILQNRLYETRLAALSAPAGRLEMTACSICGFVWNAAFETSLMVYDPHYENDQSSSDVFRAHIETRLSRLIAAMTDVIAPRVVEVGCGQGDFLARLATHSKHKLGALTGYDPAWRGRDGDGPGGAQIYRALFTRETAERGAAEPDAVVTRHTIEHIPDPVGFLSAIRQACGDRRVRLFLETPCAEWITANLQFQDWFYEHCSIFTARSLYLAMTRAGLQPTRIDHVFGGQYLWVEADPAAKPMAPPEMQRLDIYRWEAERASFVENWQIKIEAAMGQGPVYVWGVGAKGVTFTLLTDPGGTRFAGAVDANEKKQGKFIPLTGLGVISPADLPSVPFTAIIMNPNYFDEISIMLEKAGRQATLLSLTAAA